MSIDEFVEFRSALANLQIKFVDRIVTMARLYMDEQFPKVVSQLLRKMGHDILTVQEAGKGSLGIPDEDVLAVAIA